MRLLKVRTWQGQCEITEPKNDDFLSHLLLPEITILARKWRKGRRVSLLTNKLFEGICLALLEKFLQNELRNVFVFQTTLKL